MVVSNQMNENDLKIILIVSKDDLEIGNHASWTRSSARPNGSKIQHTGSEQIGLFPSEIAE